MLGESPLRGVYDTGRFSQVAAAGIFLLLQPKLAEGEWSRMTSHLSQIVKNADSFHLGKGFQKRKLRENNDLRRFCDTVKFSDTFTLPHRQHFVYVFVKE